MRVLQINAVYGTGSTGRNVAELHHGLNVRGHASFVAYRATNAVASHREGYAIGSAVGSAVHGALSRVVGTQGYFSSGATSRLLRHIDQISPDIVHLGNVHSNYLNLPMLLTHLAERDIATVLSLHDCWFFTGKCTHYTQNSCHRWKEACGKCPRLREDNPSWLFDRTTKMLSDKAALYARIPRLGVIGVSDWITGEARKSPLFRDRHITRIYNWVDMNVFQPRQADPIITELVPADKRIVLSVATGWSRSKGLDSLVALSEILPEDHQIVLVGHVPPRTHLPEQILALGAINDTVRLAQIYAAADVFVTLSLQESFGKVSAEALACGTPVVCYRATANPELVGPGCGAVVTPSNLKAASDAILQITARGRHSYAHACVAFAQESFGQEDRIDDHVVFYRKLIGEPHQVVSHE